MTIEEQLNADFDAWFAKLQALSNAKLNPDDWTERWFDYFTPQEALEIGPEGGGPWFTPTHEPVP